MPVVVVESPAKAKTINKYLGPDYTVLASFGHVRDLPPKDGSVDPEHGFAMKWEVASDSKKHIRAIAEALKTDDALILATDPDREGEAISWHLQEALASALKKGKQVSRVTFNAITKTAVTEAMKHPAPGRHGAGRGLSRPPRAGLSGRLQPVAGAVAQAARGQIGRPGAIGLPAADRRARDGDRGVPAREYWTVEAVLATPRGQTYRGAADGAGRQEARPVRPCHRHRCRTGGAGGGQPRPEGAAGRGQARRAQPFGAVHDLDPATGGQPQVRHGRQAMHVRGAAALRGRPHHLHAHRRHRHGARGGDGGARGDQRPLRRGIPSRQPAHVQEQGQERAGSA